MGLPRNRSIYRSALRGRGSSVLTYFLEYIGNQLFMRLLFCSVIKHVLLRGITMNISHLQSCDSAVTSAFMLCSFGIWNGKHLSLNNLRSIRGHDWSGSS
jgi:uncharacterized membrane protein